MKAPGADARPRGRPRGWRAANPRRTMINVRLTAAEVALLDDRVAATGTNRSAVLRALLVTEEEAMKKTAKKPAPKKLTAAQAIGAVADKYLGKYFDDLAAARAIESRREDALEQLVRRAPEIVKEITASHQPKPDPELDSLKRQVECRKLEVALRQLAADEQAIERAERVRQGLDGLTALLEKWRRLIADRAKEGEDDAGLLLTKMMLDEFERAVATAASFNARVLFTC